MLLTLRDASKPHDLLFSIHIVQYNIYEEKWKSKQQQNTATTIPCEYYEVSV